MHVARSLVCAAAIAIAGPSCDRESSPKEPAAPSAAPVTPPAASKPARDTRPALVFLGDSLTAGFGLDVDQAVPALVQAEIDRAGLSWRVVNAGRSGDTTAGGASRVDYYLRPDVGAGVLVIWLGANDVLRGLPVEQIEKNLTTIVQRAQKASPAPRVFLVQMRAFPNLGADYARAFEAIYPRVAAKTGAALLPFPLGDVAGHAELNQPDGVHPTAEGTRKVADTLWKALQPQLAPPR